jgi:hypothetical protein
VTVRLAGAAVALFLALVPVAEAGPLADTCRRVNDVLHGPCRGGEQVVRLATDLTGLPRAGVREFTGSWTHRSLVFQHRLAGDVPLRDAPWLGTHNSYNAVAEVGPALSTVDANHVLTMYEQLELGVRSLEIDVHWFPALLEGAARKPVVCHGRGADQAHFGCTLERSLDPVLRGIRRWLDEHPGEVLLLYVEDHLEGEAGYAAAAAAIEGRLGDVLWRPPSGGAACDELPLDLTRDEVAAAGKQVIVVSDCGAGAAWRAIAFDWSSHVETRPRGFRDFPDCGPDFERADYDGGIVRYFEDSTALTATLAGLGQERADDGIRPATAAAMLRCGVDLLGLDQLVPDDPRLPALVWSWAPGEPAGEGACAIQRADRRWEARPCEEAHRIACRDGGGWVVTETAAPAAEAGERCAAAGATHDAPRTGHENARLRAAAGDAIVWLGIRRDRGGWAPVVRR